MDQALKERLIALKALLWKAMNIAIRFYSISKDLAGRNEMSFAVEENTTLREALNIVLEELPALKQIQSSARYAIGVEFAMLDAHLSEGDTISIIPPVQGG